MSGADSGIDGGSGSKGNIKHRFSFSIAASENGAEDSATSLAWLPTQQNQFVVGYDSGTLAFFDIIGNNLSSAQKIGSMNINVLAPHPSRSLLCCGHEDGSISVFDFSADKVIKRIEGAHKDAVSSLAISSTGLQMITGSHDGKLKVWNLRKVGTTLDDDEKDEPLFTVEQAHSKKYDEGVQALSIHPTQPFVATGGADSII